MSNARRIITPGKDSIDIDTGTKNKWNWSWLEKKITADVNKVLYISDGCWTEFNIYYFISYLF